jgi:hypothetical protein
MVCATVTVGPLPAGTYATRLDVTNTSDETSFSVFDQMVVFPDPEDVPTNSTTGNAFLVLALWSCALWSLRRRSGAT